MNKDIYIKNMRVIRKSIEGADELYRKIGKFYTNLEIPKDIRVNKEFFTNYEIDENNLGENIDRLEKQLKEVANLIDPCWAIPILLQLYTYIYFDNSIVKDKTIKENNKNFGCAVKRLILVFTRFLDKENAGDKKNRNLLFTALYISYCVSLLYEVRPCFSYYENFRISTNDNILDFPDDDESINNYYNFFNSMEGRGTRLRSAKIINTLFSEQGDKVFYAIKEITENNADPSSLDVFKGTIFEKIGNKEDSEKEFWKALFQRYICFLCIVNACADVESSKNVCILNNERWNEFLSSSLIVSEGDWACKLPSAEYNNLITLKPIIKIKGIYYTSFAFLTDTIAPFVEEAIFGYHREYKLFCSLPDSVFKNVISEPFEEKCINLFRKNGFLAGHISESNTWITQNGSVVLKSDSMIPGEVDVFAYDERNKVGFLIECKVLRDMFTQRAFSNYRAKIEDDSESFRAKIRKKKQWLLSQKTLMLPNVLSFIISDMQLPLFQRVEHDTNKNDVYYFTFDDLKNIITEFLDKNT